MSDTVSDYITKKAQAPSHTEGTTRAEEVGAKFQAKHPDPYRSDAAGGSRIDTKKSPGLGGSH